VGLTMVVLIAGAVLAIAAFFGMRIGPI
jgi:hypothetical protein